VTSIEQAIQDATKAINLIDRQVHRCRGYGSLKAKSNAAQLAIEQLGPLAKGLAVMLVEYELEAEAEDVLAWQAWEGDD